MDLLTRRKTAENIMGHECKNTEVGVGRDAQVEVIPWTMARGGVDRSMEFDVFLQKWCVLNLVKDF